jgi:mannitol/fructose-specific phosphotransferase system IIA component (Ntr-type)
MDLLTYLDFVKFYESEQDIHKEHGLKRQIFAANEKDSIRALLRASQTRRESSIGNPLTMPASKIRCIDALALTLAEAQYGTRVSSQISPIKGEKIAQAYLAILNGILEKEMFLTSGVQYDLAVPRTKLADDNSPSRILTGMYIIRQGIDWASTDGYPIHICLGVVSPEQNNAQYLNLLTHYSSVFKSAKTRENIIHASSFDEVKNCIRLRSDELKVSSI